MAHNSLLHVFLVYSGLHCHTIVIHQQLCVNNIEVTVNTCTCTDVFTVITNQVGYVYNSNSTGGLVVVNKPCPHANALGLSLFTIINAWHCAI